MRTALLPRVDHLGPAHHEIRHVERGDDQVVLQRAGGDQRIHHRPRFSGGLQPGGERAPNQHGRRIRRDQALAEALDDYDEAIKDQKPDFSDRTRI